MWLKPTKLVSKTWVRLFRFILSTLAGTNEAIMIDTWKGMEDLYKDNKVKNIGVSNFNPDHFEALLAQVSIKPVINQVEFHPYFTQEKLRKYLEAQNIYMESWSPFMNAQILNDETLNEIGKKLINQQHKLLLNGICNITSSLFPNQLHQAELKKI